MLRDKDRDGTLFPYFKIDKKGSEEYEDGREHYSHSYSIGDERYQIIATLLHEHDEKGQILDVLEGKEIWKNHFPDWGWDPSIRFISVPYGAYYHNFFALTDHDGVDHYDRGWRNKYELFLRQKQETVRNDHFAEKLRTFLFSDKTYKEKVELLQNLFEPVTSEDDSSVTLERVIDNFECLIGTVFQEASEEFKVFASKQESIKKPLKETPR